PRKGETARPRSYTGSRPLALDRRRPPALDLSLARVRGGDRGPALVRGPPALHRSAAARLRHCHPPALVGPGLEVAGVLHARARADAVPALLPGRRGVGVPVRHRGARESRPALRHRGRLSLLAALVAAGAARRHPPGAVRVHALLEPGAADRLLQLRRGAAAHLLGARGRLAARRGAVGPGGG